jgi:hypothetical protein
MMAPLSPMPFTHTVEGRLLHIHWSGVVSRDDLQRFGGTMPGLVAGLGFVPDVLHSFEAVEGYSFQPFVVYLVSLLRKRVTIPAPVRAAAVATKPELLKLAQLFKALNGSPNLTIEVFRTEAAARAWLGEK